MARHHHRRHHARGSRSLIRGVSNTTLAIGAAAAYFLLRPAPHAGTAGLYDGSAGSRVVGPGLGLLHPEGLIAAYQGNEPMGMRGLGAWGRPVLPVAGRGLGFFHGFRGGLGAFEAEHGFWPAHTQGGLGALVRSIHGQLTGAGLGTVHVTDYGNEFVGGHPRGLGRFGNVSINRRWWT